MRFLKRADVRLAFEDNNAALPPMLLVHGCGLDHHSLTKIADFFSKSYRVISVDLRGHGRSDAPYQEYTVPAFADDLAWLCAELTLPKVCVVGHSMGGERRVRVSGAAFRAGLYDRHDQFDHASVGGTARGSSVQCGRNTGCPGVPRSI